MKGRLLFFQAAFIGLFFLSADLSAQNLVSTYAGTGAIGLVNGDTSVAQFRAPFGMCIDNNGNLFIADQDNHCIRKITPDGIVSIYAGTGVAGYADGVDSLSQFNAPINVCADTSGNIYVSDFQNQYIRKISTDGTVSTVAGNGIAGYQDGPALSASFNYPRGICIDAAGNLYVGDSWNHRIRKIDVNGEVMTYAGGGTSTGVQSVGDYIDGNDTSARFYTPCGLSIDDAGNVYVADAYNHCIRRIDPLRVVTTFAGVGSPGTASGDYVDGDVSVARFNTLTELFYAQNGSLYIGDTYNHRIREVANGMVTTVAGNGSPGLVNGIDTSAEFNRPRGIVTDIAGSHLYISDNLNHVIRKITLEEMTGVEDYLPDTGLFVFPNPSNGIISINGYYNISENTRFPKRVIVKDVSGKEVRSIEFSGPVNEIELRSLPSGVYFLTFFFNNSQSDPVKLLIQK